MASRRALKDPDVILALVRFAEDNNLQTYLTGPAVSKVTGHALSTAKAKIVAAKTEHEVEKAAGGNADGVIDTSNAPEKPKRGRKRKDAGGDSAAANANEGEPSANGTTKAEKPRTVKPKGSEKLSSKLSSNGAPTVKDEDELAV